LPPIRVLGRFGDKEYAFTKVRLFCPGQDQLCLDRGTDLSLYMRDHVIGNTLQHRWTDRYYSFGSLNWIGVEMFFQRFDTSTLGPFSSSPSHKAYMQYDHEYNRFQTMKSREKLMEQDYVNVVTFYLRAVTSRKVVDRRPIKVWSDVPGELGGLFTVLCGVGALGYHFLRNPIKQILPPLKSFDTLWLEARGHLQAQEGPDLLHDPHIN